MEEQIFVQSVKVGQVVPNFSAKALMTDQSFGEVSLEENMKNGKWTIMFFWPLDFTFVCPTEILSMSDYASDFEKEDAIIFGVSTDSVHSHLAWTKSEPKDGGIGKINFPLLEDTNHVISDMFGVLVEDAGIALRGVFIISPEGVLESAQINNLSVGRNAGELFRTLQAFKSGGLCAANWKKGDTNL